MDMILYTLLMKELQEQTENKIWNGFRIEVVDEVPTTQVANTIYFVKSKVLVGEE